MEFRNSVKYLGVILDSKLLWREHIENKIAKCKRLLNLLRKQTYNVYGPSPVLSAWIYTGIVRPAITYAVLCWAHSINNAKLRAGLHKLDRLGLLSITGCAPSVPTRGLQVIYEVEPLEILVKKIGSEHVSEISPGVEPRLAGASRD